MKLAVSIRKFGKRSGFLTLDVVLGIAVLGIGMVFVIEATSLALQERGRSETRLLASEMINNVLEAGRALPVDQLEKWAQGQKATPALEKLFSKPELAVRVKPFGTDASSRRVEAELSWLDKEGKRVPPVSLVTLFASHSIQPKGEKP